MQIKQLFLLPVVLCSINLQAAIVISHDINTFGTRIAGSQEEAFAVNVANFLLGDSTTRNILLFESNPGDGSRDFSNGVVSGLSRAGFSVAVAEDYNMLYSNYDAIFVAQDYPAVGFLDNGSLIDYANGGGGVYLAGGVGLLAAIEATGWSDFLNNYGLSFSTSGYNGINSVTITSSHEIFDGITSLKSGNGQSIIDLGTNPNARIVQSTRGQAVYAVVDPVPLPPVVVLFASGLIGLYGLTRKFCSTVKAIELNDISTASFSECSYEGV